MKLKQNALSLPAIVFFTGLLYLSLTQVASAGDMVIEEGAVFRDTMAKDGRRVEVTKTYTRDGVVIEQKIYDAETGALIREKSRTNPIKDHVRIVSPGEGSSLRQQDNNTPNQLPVDRIEKPTAASKADEAAEKTQSAEMTVPSAESQSQERTEKVEDPEAELTQEVGPDVIAEKSRQLYGFSRFDRIMVAQGSGKPELSLEGVRQRKLLGLFAIELPAAIIVDGESGELVEEKVTLRARLLEMLSF